MKMNDVTPESSGASISPTGGNNNNNNNNSINGNGKASGMTTAAMTANGGEGISAAVAKVLQGYDWTLVPVATK